MNLIALIELVAFATSCLGIWLVNQARVRLTSDGRLTLFVLFTIVGAVHFIDALEWSGLEGADRFGDILKIFTPAAWLFFLFVVRRDGLLQQVHRQDQQLSFFFEQAPMALAVLDEQQRYRAASQRWLELHEIASSPRLKRLGEEGSQLAQTWAAILGESQEQGSPQHGLYERDEGKQTRYFEWKLRHLEDRQSANWTIVLVEDVSDRVREEQSRARAQTSMIQQQHFQTVGEIAAGVAHDVNNLLQVIGAHTTAIEYGDATPDDFKESLNSIRDAVLSASGMTRLLLRQGGQDRPQFKDLDLLRLLSRVSHILDKAIAQDQELIIDAPAEALTISGNETLIEQLIINLVLNARDALAHGGTINVRVSPHDGGARLDVTDDGEGIELSIQDQIMDPFFTTKGERGTGMGLAVVHRVVQAHQATLEFKSSPGKGTRFSIFFPAPKTLPSREQQVQNAS